MPDRPEDPEEKTGIVQGKELEPAPVDKLRLVVSAEGLLETHKLPGAGAVTIGRAAGNTVRIDHPSISRAHAVLTIGGTIRICDLGSSNGTKVAGHVIDPNVPVEVGPGDAIEIGAVMAMVQRLASSLPPRRIWTHDYFEARVEEECARRARTGGIFSIVRIHATGEGATEGVESALRRTLRAHDVVARYAPDEYELLLDAPADQAQEIVDRLVARFADTEITARTGIATYPADGANAEELVARANAAVRGSTPGDAPDVSESDGAMSGLRELIARVAASNISVLILGETGVGKEVTAETIHRQSPRKNAPFLRLNCAALNEQLLESELFGHERGAFTGAFSQKKGLLESVDGGTVFLDEVAELPPTVQAKLLRVLEERRVTRVGGLQSKAIDVRFVSATNKDLETEVARGRFRQDLVFRLDGVTLVVPPLRERVQEIGRLAHAFVQHAAIEGERPPQLTPGALALLERYPWPGNIRELRNVIDRAVLLCGHGPITAAHLPVEKMNATIASIAARTSAAPPPLVLPQPVAFGSEASTGSWPAVRVAPPPSSSSSLRDDIERVERQRIVDALEQCAYNQTKAAKMLGVARGTLIARLEQYGIGRPRKPRDP